ncbi:hypothetical protein C349_00156 [Cryptococcus neoformans var. grubii Br795]|nr:hypothetical protein C350_00172 [Cryptococcus neoformans var. grubii MW-RSA36]OXG93826.1 hypothetical protein C349_00156 [Cryptococcus neoformans var. grubii Br795]OXL11408.1 hypothetical protein C348_00170 [Cryptococcus neoformans var. grubii Gb118]
MANPFSPVDAPPSDHDGSPPRQSGSSKFIILGPNIGQYFEVSSSEGSNCSSSPSTPSHSPNRLNHRHSFDPSNGRSRSPTECDEIDWVEYSSLAIGMEACQMPSWASSVSELSEGDSETESSVIITPDRDIRDGRQSQRLDIQDIALLLKQTSIKSECLALRPNRLSSRTTSSHTVVPCDFNRRCSEPRSVASGSSSSSNAPQLGDPSQHGDTVACEACGRGTTITNAKKIMPCQDITCASCFSSTLGAVTVAQSQAKCPVCLCLIDTFESVTLEDIVKLQLCSEECSTITLASPFKRGLGVGPVVMKIDNVAWDITPATVEAFLPRNSLSHSTLQPIHILLDRFDGRTKDYLVCYAAFRVYCCADYSLRKQYIEAATPQAAQTILKTCQNNFMSGGALTSGRKRPVTITPVSHSELIEELRPHSAQELHSLLTLCQAAVDSNSGCKLNTSKYIKSRHGPYYALMSAMSKLNGEQSPSYWDMFYVASGAISALSKAITRQTYFHSSQSSPARSYPATDATTHVSEEDILVRNKLLMLFERCFGMMPRAN